MNPDLLHKAASYCSTTEHCESEVRAKLIAWGAQQFDIQEIISYLYQENYLSTSRYCKAFVHDKLLYQGWGKKKMSMMLQMKGLPKEAIFETLQALDEHEYAQVIKSLIDKKKRALRAFPEPQQREKIIRHLLSRGFSYNEIEKAL